MSQKYQREHHAVLRIRISSTLFECCGYSRSGSSYEFLQFRILPIVFKHIWKLNYKKNILLRPTEGEVETMKFLSRMITYISVLDTFLHNHPWRIDTYGI